MEQEFYEINKKSVDKGWAAMRQMLDAEMPSPEKRRRRGFFWLWFLLGLGVFAGAGFALLLDAPKPDALPLPEKSASPKTPVAAVGEGQKETPETPILTSPVNISEQKISSGTGPKTENPPAPKNAGEGKISTGKGGRGFLPETRLALQTPPLEVFGGNLPAFQNPNPAENIEQKTEKTAPQRSGIAPENEPLVLKFFLKNLPPTPPQLLERQQVMPEILRLAVQAAEPVPAKNSPGNWRLGLNTGASAMHAPKPETYFGGLLLDWQPNEKFGFRAGLNFRASNFKASEKTYPVLAIGGHDYLKNTGDSTFIFSVETATLPSHVMDNLDIDSIIAATQIIFPISQKRVLEIPVQAFFQPFEQWRVYGGISFSRLLSVKSSSLQLTDSQTAGATITSENSDQTRSNTLIVNNLPKWSSDATLGIGWNWRRKFEVSLSARMPLRSMFGVKNTSDEGDVSPLLPTPLYAFYKNWRPVSVQLSGAYFF